MKKSLFTLIVFGLVLKSSAQILLTEDFSSYTAGQSVEKSAQNTGTLGEWSVAYITQQGISPLVIPEALTYNDYVLSGKGKTMSISYVDQATSEFSDPQRTTILCFSENALPKPSDSGFEEGSNTIYTAFLVCMDGTGPEKAWSNVDIFSYGKEAPNDFSMLGRVRVMKDQGSKRVRYTIYKRSLDSSNITWSAWSPLDKAALLVVKYTNNSEEGSGDNDSFELFVNPDPTKSESENESVRIIPTDNDQYGGLDIRHIGFRLQKSQQQIMKIGGISVAKTFTDAVFDSTSSGMEILKKDAGVGCLVDGKFIINDAFNGQVFLYKIDGCLLHTYDVKGESSFEVNVDKGMYLLQFKSDSGQIMVQKVIVG